MRELLVNRHMFCSRVSLRKQRQMLLSLTLFFSWQSFGNGPEQSEPWMRKSSSNLTVIFLLITFPVIKKIGVFFFLFAVYVD